MPPVGNPQHVMGKLSATQVASYAKQAGFPQAEIPMAVAVAFLESGFDPNARALTSREDSRGLWQINVFAHPQYASQNLYDPATNARAAHEVWTSASGWRPWSTADRARLIQGQYGGAAASASNTSALSIPGAIGNATDALSNLNPLGPLERVAQALGRMVDAMARAGTFLVNPQNWLRIGYVILGGVLMVGALYIVARPVVEPAVKTAAKVATVAA